MPEILVVDDEPNIRRMVGAILSGEGFSVRDAANGAAGVRAASEREPDAVLLDLMMPGELDGMAALSQLRERFPSLPVVMMSGRAELSDAVRATKLGAFHFLEKPLTHECDASHHPLRARAAAGAPRGADAARGVRAHG